MSIELNLEIQTPSDTFLEKIGHLDNLLAPLYYFLDAILLSQKRKNLNLIIAEKNNMKESIE